VGRYKGRIREVFGSERDDEQAEWYVDRVLESWRDTTTQLRRTSVLLIVSLLAFALLSSGDAQSVSVASIKVANIDPVIALAPVVIAFLYLDLVLQLFSAYEYSELYTDASKQIRPELHKHELDVPLAPTLGAMWGGRSILSAGMDKTASTRAVDVLNALCGVAFLLLPFLFLVWAIVTVIVRFGIGDPLVMLSLLASLACVARALGIAGTWLEAARADLRDTRARLRSRGPNPAG
jgi:hypothetical protein